MKTVIIISLIFLAFVSFLDARPKLKLYMNFSKNTYITGEYQQFEIGAVNISNNLYSKGWDKLTINIIDESGNNVRYLGIAGEAEGRFSGKVYLPWEGQLEPGGKAYTIMLLNDLFGKRWPSLATVDLYLDPGKYTLRGTLYLQDGDTSKSEVSFQVIEPSGDDLFVYNSFVNIITNLQKCKNPSQITSELQSLLDAHLNTAYAPLILDILSAYYFYGVDDYKKGLNADKELVEKYPWSVRSLGALKYILETIKSDSERIKYIEKIQEKSKGTMME